MNCIVASCLITLTVFLFISLRRKWIKNETLQNWANVAGVVGLFATFASLLAPNLFEKQIDFQKPYTPLAEIIQPPTYNLFRGKILQTLEQPLSTRSVAVKDEYVYLLTRDGVLHTYNLASLPTEKKFKTYSSSEFSMKLSNDGNGVLRVGEYLYAYGYSGFQILDIQNPEHPSIVSSKNDLSINNLIRQEDFLIAVGDGEYAIYRLENSYTPLLLSKTSIGSGISTFGVALDGTILYISVFDYPDYSEIYIFDIHDPNNPEFLSSIDSKGTAYHLLVIEDYLVACATEELVMWDLGIPSNPSLVTSEKGNGRVCIADNKNVVTNGKVFRLEKGLLEFITSFEPEGSQVDGSPYGSDLNSRFIFIAQSSRILILIRPFQ